MRLESRWLPLLLGTAQAIFYNYLHDAEHGQFRVAAVATRQKKEPKRKTVTFPGGIACD